MIKQVKELKKWMAESKENLKTAQVWFKYYRIKRSIEFLEQYNAKKSWGKLEKKIKVKKQNYHLIYTCTTIAASLLLLFVLNNLSHKSTENQNHPNSASTIDAFPEIGSRKAILTLHTGEEIYLSFQEEKFITNNTDTLLLIKPNESLIYNETARKSTEPLKYNTLTVPRGGEFQLILSDGTKVWLNAESSLHYPTSFSQNREVTLIGEAYFEVAKKKNPFIIHMGEGQKVEVLGTKFNISAYSGHPIFTTLSEGGVKIYSAGHSVILSPNQQAVVETSGKIKVETVDAKLFTSWSQGIYQFKKTELSEIIAQLSRWYDVNILFENEQLKHKQFSGVIFRNYQLGFAVETIETVSNIKFATRNDTIYIIK